LWNEEENDPEQKCHHGNLPEYAVAVETPQEVADTISFCVKFDIKISVKSSGHAPLG
jgi:hypothetical protein